MLYGFPAVYTFFPLEFNFHKRRDLSFSPTAMS